MQLLLGHTKLESTVTYLGIEVDDALEIAEQTEIYGYIGAVSLNDCSRTITVINACLDMLIFSNGIESLRKPEWVTISPRSPLQQY